MLWQLDVTNLPLSEAIVHHLIAVGRAGGGSALARLLIAQGLLQPPKPNPNPNPNGEGGGDRTGDCAGDCGWLLQSLGPALEIYFCSKPRDGRPAMLGPFVRAPTSLRRAALQVALLP